MPTQAFEYAVRRATQRAAASFGQDIKRLREDAGIPIAALAREAGLDRSYVRRIEEGEAEASIEACARLTAALGADVALRAYPNTGSPIHDRYQAPIGEALLGIAHHRWRRYSELAVRHPSRGWIDFGFHDPEERTFIATEIESGLRRLEQQVRWAREKATSLGSWDGWSALGSEPSVSTLLVVRDTRTNRDVVREFRRQLRAAYPADPRDALDALVSRSAWPGSSMLWAVRKDGGEQATPSYRIVARP